MNSIEITRNKPEFIQNEERNYFLVISKQDQSRWRCQTMPCIFVITDKAMRPVKNPLKRNTCFHTEFMTGEGTS